MIGGKHRGGGSIVGTLVFGTLFLMFLMPIVLQTFTDAMRSAWPYIIATVLIVALITILLWWWRNYRDGR